ncbi:MAG: hypothetical protein GX548_01085 [Lentisphaerae bacterium]|nr:hypothetical protein [Lentisphaerota bacterium]
MAVQAGRWQIFGLALMTILASGRAQDGNDAEPARNGAPLTPLVNRGDWNASASSKESDFAPARALVPEGRWSSSFSDDQWWAVDFGREEQLGGIRLRWEDAHAESYAVLVSTDGEQWDEVHATISSLGGTEIIEFPPRPVRHVKLDLRRRATEWGYSLWEVSFNPWELCQRSWEMSATASSGQNGAMGAEKAIDGDSATRWSSDFSDDEWWQVEFARPVPLAGLRILWETAFAENYRILVSDDGDAWTPVYEVNEGDGGPDFIFFRPVEARFLRIHCTQRGTGWGNSIWDVRFFSGSECLRAEASSAAPGGTPDLAVDGRLDTAWRPADENESTLTVHLPERMLLGGLVLTWQEAFATAYELELSEDGESWKTVAEQQNGGGGENQHFFAAAPARAVRLTVRDSQGGPAALARIELKGAEEQATPIRHYQAKARNLRRDLFPMWLSRLQEFWTIVGLPEEPNESLFSETGILEPFKHAFSVQPMVWADGELRTWADVELEQELQDRILPLPTVRWKTDGWQLEISAVMSGPESARFTAVRYRFIPEASAPADARLALAIRPVQLNPGWQHGGYSPIPEGRFEPAGDGSPARFFVENTPRLLMPVAPSAMGAAALDDGEIGEYLLRGEIPGTLTASDAEGKVGAAAWFDLADASNAPVDVVVVFPLDPEAAPPAELMNNPSGGFESLWQTQRADWTRLLARPEIDIPEPRLIEVMKSNLAYILINRDGPWFKPGPRNYNHAWMRDGVLTGAATLRCGITDMVRDFIVHFARHIREDGWVPWMILEGGNPVAYNHNPDSGEGHEYDSQGQYPFILRQYLDYSGDEEFVREMVPGAIQAIRFARKLRERRMTDEYRTDPDKQAYYGLLPHSNSHEGYYPARHSYWDGFWLLRGIKDAIVLAERFGLDDDAVWLRREEESVRRDFYASMLRVIRDAGLEALPGCVELADFDPTSTTMGLMVADERDHLPQPYGTNTFFIYWDELVSRMQPGGAKLYTPYEVRNADAFVRLGWRERALEALRFFIRDGVRPAAWNHMGEVVHTSLRTPAYIGDLPHTWVGADYVNAVRSLFVFEDNEALVLAGGIDPAWLDPGVSVKNLPTPYGSVGYRMCLTNGVLHIDLSGRAHPPGGIRIPLPDSLAGAEILLNGKPQAAENGVLLLEGIGEPLPEPSPAAPAPGLRRDASSAPEDPLVLEWLKQVQDTTTPEQQLLGSMQDQQLQTFNNALAAMAFLLHGETERAERILDFFANATDRDNPDPALQNFFVNGEARGFFQSARRTEENGRPVYRAGDMNDRWMGDLCWLLLAYRHHEQVAGPGKYDDIQILLRDLLASWYTPATRSLGGYVRHGWRQGDQRLHEDHGHPEGNIDAYAVFRVIGETERARQVRLWLEASLTGRDLPLDLYTWRALAYGPEAASLLDIPDGDPKYRKKALVGGRSVTGVWHGADPRISGNFWCDGIGHMACAFYAVGEPERGHFYANQLDFLLRDIDIHGVRTRSLPYTLNRQGGYDWVDPAKGFVSTAAWYVFAKNRFNPLTLRRED